jgi:hypothetical protein
MSAGRPQESVPDAADNDLVLLSAAAGHVVTDGLVTQALLNP